MDEPSEINLAENIAALIIQEDPELAQLCKNYGATEQGYAIEELLDANAPLWRHILSRLGKNDLFAIWSHLLRPNECPPYDSSLWRRVIVEKRDAAQRRVDELDALLSDSEQPDNVVYPIQVNGEWIWG